MSSKNIAGKFFYVTAKGTGTPRPYMRQVKNTAILKAKKTPYMMKPKGTALYDSTKAPMYTAKHDPETARLITRSKYKMQYQLLQSEILNKIDLNDQNYDFKGKQQALNKLRSDLVTEQNWVV